MLAQQLLSSKEQMSEAVNAKNSLTDTALAIQSTHHHKPSAPMSPEVFFTTAFNALKVSIGDPVLMLYFANVNAWSLGLTLGMTLGTWPVIYAANFWSELNQLKGRLQQGFSFETLPRDPNERLSQNTLYFFISDEDQQLHYNIIVPKEVDLENQDSIMDTEEVKTGSLATLYSDSSELSQQLITKILNAIEIENDTHNTSSGLSSTIKLTRTETKIVEQIAKTQGHKPRRELDAIEEPGTEIDHWYSAKVMFVVMTTASINATSLAIALTQGKGIEMIVAGVLIFSMLNALQMFYDIYQTFNEHAKETTRTFLNHGETLSKGNIQGIKQHFPFNLLSRKALLDLYLICAPIIQAALNGGSFYNLIASYTDNMGLKAIIGAFSFWLYMNSTTAMIHYNMSVMQRVLSASKVEFNIQNYFSRVNFSEKTPLNTLLANSSHLLGEILSYNYLLIELPARYAVSPEKIAKVSLTLLGLGSIALNYVPICMYLICPEQGCFEEEGLLIRSMTPGGAKKLNSWSQSAQEDIGVNPFALMFGALMAGLLVATYFTVLSRYFTFAESAKKHLEKNTGWKESVASSSAGGKITDAIVRVMIRALYFENPCKSNEQLDVIKERKSSLLGASERLTMYNPVETQLRTTSSQFSHRENSDTLTLARQDP